jgi:hypothetical protein
MKNIFILLAFVSSTATFASAKCFYTVTYYGGSGGSSYQPRYNKVEINNESLTVTMVNSKLEKARALACHYKIKALRTTIDDGQPTRNYDVLQALNPDCTKTLEIGIPAKLRYTSPSQTSPETTDGIQTDAFGIEDRTGWQSMLVYPCAALEARLKE